MPRNNNPHPRQYPSHVPRQDLKGLAAELGARYGAPLDSVGDTEIDHHGDNADADAQPASASTTETTQAAAAAGAEPLPILQPNIPAASTPDLLDVRKAIVGMPAIRVNGATATDAQTSLVPLARQIWTRITDAADPNLSLVKVPIRHSRYMPFCTQGELAFALMGVSNDSVVSTRDVQGVLAYLATQEGMEDAFRQTMPPNTNTLTLHVRQSKFNNGVTPLYIEYVLPDELLRMRQLARRALRTIAPSPYGLSVLRLNVPTICAAEAMQTVQDILQEPQFSGNTVVGALAAVARGRHIPYDPSASPAASVVNRLSAPSKADHTTAI